jgi:glycogen debranching enzyme
MIHLTPIQELGRSKSSYCLSNQLKLNPEFSSNSKEYTYEDVSQLIEWMRSEWNVLSITDIVLNHTANESEWLRTHPECAYNCLNSPWLRPAYLLDRLIWHFTCDIIDERWQSRGLNTEIGCENDLNLIRCLFYEQYLPDVCFVSFLVFFKLIKV